MVQLLIVRGKQATEIKGLFKTLKKAKKWCEADARSGLIEVLDFRYKERIY